MRTMLLPALWVGGLSCAEVEHHPVELPPEVTHVALLEMIGDRLVGATALLPWQPGRSLELALGQESDGLLLGFAEDQLLSLGATITGLESVPLELADPSPCSRRLPPPLEAGKWTPDGRFEVMPVAETPPVVADWFEPACRLPPHRDLRFDLHGQATECELTPEVEELDDCRFRVRLCTPPRTPTHFVFGDQGYGPICIESPRDTGSTCVAVEGESSGWATGRCEGLGTFDILDASVEIELAGPAASYQLVPEIPIVEQWVTPERCFDVLPLSDQVLVSLTEQSEFGCSAVAQVSPRTLLSLNLETGQVIRSSTVPPCFSKMAADPATSGMLATFFRAGDFHLGRFTLEGREIASIPLPFTSQVDHEVSVRGLERLADGTLGILIARERPRPADRERIGVESRFYRVSSGALSLDGEPLDFTHLISTPLELGLGPDEFLLSGGWSQELHRIARDGSASVLELSFPADHGLSFYPLMGSTGLSDGTVVASSNRGPLRFVDPLGERWEEGPIFDKWAISGAGIHWPVLGPNSVAFLASTSVDTRLVRVDVKTRRLTRSVARLDTTFRPLLKLGQHGELWVLDGFLGKLIRLDQR